MCLETEKPEDKSWLKLRPCLQQEGIGLARATAGALDPASPPCPSGQRSLACKWSNFWLLPWKERKGPWHPEEGPARIGGIRKDYATERLKIIPLFNWRLGSLF